jgi:site-specific DNA-methyltransferase (adenine-specific)
MTWTLVEGDCVERMADLADASVDAVVCDPPYGLEFMGKDWDRLGGGVQPTPTSAGGVEAYSRARIRYGQSARSMQAWHEAWAREALRVLKPGGHLLAFGGTRTYHRLACAIEDAGFEIRDCIVWLYGSGFPKALNLDGEWEGWGTALKPGNEPIVVARKPLIGTVARNVQEHGTGALNVDGCRIATSDDLNGGAYAKNGTPRDDGWGMERGGAGVFEQPLGRWPANVVLDEDAAAMLDEQSGERPTSKPGSTARVPKFDGDVYNASCTPQIEWGYGDEGGASRFFYVAKASTAERNAGLDGFDEQAGGIYGGGAGIPKLVTDENGDSRYATPLELNRTRANVHPTVKPIDLMRWLVRLVTPPGGLVLDPFTGSGTTGCAAVLEGFDFVGIEREPEYVGIARARIEFWAEHPTDLPIEEALVADRERRRVRDSGQLALGF